MPRRAKVGLLPPAAASRIAGPPPPPPTWHQSKPLTAGVGHGLTAHWDELPYSFGVDGAFGDTVEPSDILQQFAQESKHPLALPLNGVLQHCDASSFGYQSVVPGSDPYGSGHSGIPLNFVPFNKRQSPSIQSEDLISAQSTSSSSISCYSNCTTLSPVNAEFPALTDGLSSVSNLTDGVSASSTSWSRGPSPLPQMSNPSLSKQDLVDMRDPDLASPAAPSSVVQLDNNEAAPHAVGKSDGYACNWAACRAPGFRSREGLNWHVKAEHLLICPVLGCCEGNFHGKTVLDSHIRVVHPKADPASLGGEESQGGVAAGPSGEQTDVAPVTASAVEDNIPTPKADDASWDAVNDPAMKMTLSIATSKRKCREQLKTVMEKRMKRASGTPRSVAGTPRSVGSPQDLVRSRTPRLIESASFPTIWEHGILPFLIEFIPKWCGPGHVISVTRGKDPNARRICIMTKKKVSRARRLFIAVHVRDLLPASYRHTATFCFSTGEVDRLVWARGLGKDMPDEVCKPRNPFCYVSPCMGDSIGTAESTSTLGPCLLVGGSSYWLANFHPFEDTFNQVRGEIRVEQPSPADRERCLGEGHDALVIEDIDFNLGQLTATSGFDIKTTRLSHDLYWEENDKEHPLIVTDWSLISSDTKQANMLRKFPTTTPRLTKEVPVTSMSAIIPGANVVSTGRTSGHQRGQICEIPAHVSGDSSGNGTGYGTREWFIEEPYPYDDEEEWIRGGIGVEGDSGAAIVDADTNALLGQLWGRNNYWGSGPRHTFFTPINDILDDIQERCKEQSRPQLPQYRDEGDGWIVYPVCQTCFDLTTYLDSRRSSRESLRSMIGNSESVRMFGEDKDITSTENQSELLTPKDQSYWLRHAGPEEVGMSFTHIVSPTPLGSFSFNAPAVSPRVAEALSPYALQLDSEDLIGPEYGPPDIASGKRAAVSMTRSSSNEQNKKRKVAAH